MERLQGVNFVSRCMFSHRAPDDPIVFPGKPGMSHDHSFVGNTTTNASSTLSSLLAGGTTCEPPGRHGGLLDADPLRGRPGGYADLRPDLLPAQDDPPCRGVPARLPHDRRELKGDAPQPVRVTFWNCGVDGGVAPTSTVPTCPDAGRHALRLHVTFPLLGRQEPRQRRSSEPRDVPRRGPLPGTARARSAADLAHLPLPGHRSGQRVLASGSPFSAHADFFNAWRQSDLQALVDGCLDALRHCQRGS